MNHIELIAGKLYKLKIDCEFRIHRTGPNNFVWLNRGQIILCLGNGSTVKFKDPYTNKNYARHAILFLQNNTIYVRNVNYISYELEAVNDETRIAWI